MSTLSPAPKMQFLNINGVPLAGGRVYTYLAGTTTLQATFTDSGTSSYNSNPVILDGRGEANIWLGPIGYKMKLTDSNGVEIWTVDNITGTVSSVSPTFSGSVEINSDSVYPALKITQTGTGAVLRVQDSEDPDSTPFIIDTDGNVGIGTGLPAEKLNVSNGTILISSAATPYSRYFANASSTFITAEAARSFIIQTNSATRLTVGTSLITATLPLVLPADPTTALQAATKQYVDAVLPAGVIVPYGGTTYPAGWLPCNGGAVSRTGRAALFAAIGTTWGAGDGVTTFNVPNLYGAFLRGYTPTAIPMDPDSPRAVGSYQADENKIHSHTIAYSDVGTTAGSLGTATLGAGGLSATTSSTGGVEARPRNYAVFYIIKI